MMSHSRVRVSLKRFETSSQSSSSSLLTSTPVLGRPILTNEPAQSPIEQKNSSQTIVTPARANLAPVRGRLSLSSVSLNESSNCGYRTRSRSRIHESSSFLDQLNTPKRNSKTIELTVRIPKLAQPLKPEGDNIGRENALPNVKKTGAIFSIFKPNSTSPLTRSRTEASFRGVREKQSTKTANGRYGSTGNIIKSIIDNKEKTKNEKNPSKCICNESLQEWARYPFIELTKKYPKEFDDEVIKFFDLPRDAPKAKAGAKINNQMTTQKKLSSEKINSKNVKVLQKQSLESQIPIKTQNKILAKPVINKHVLNNKKIPVDLPAQRKEPALPQNKKSAPPQSKKPAPPQSKKPASPQSEEPAPHHSEEPAPPQSKESAPPQSKKPAPPQSKKPAPPQSKKPPPSQSEEPAPPQSKKPAPPQSKKPSPLQSKESDLSQRNNTEKEIMCLEKIPQAVNGRKSSRIKAAEVASKEKSFTQANNAASNKSIPRSQAGNTPLAVDDTYSNNNATEDCHSHCIGTRISDNFSKPSFIRRKLYSRTSDYDDNESTKQVDRSFLEKKDKQNLYSLSNKESNRKNIESVSSFGEDGEQLEDPAKAAENRQYCLRKKVDKNFTKFFCDSEKIIDCAIKDANDAKESTSKLVSNILKNINRQNTSKEHPSDDTDKVTAKDQINDEASNKKTETINPELDDSSFDIFTRKEKDTSKSPTRRKAKSKVSKAKPPKKIIKPSVKKVLEIPKRRSREKPKNKESVGEELNSKIIKKSSKVLEKPATAGLSLRSKNKSIIIKKTYSRILRKSDQALNYSDVDAVVSNMQSKDVIKGSRVASNTHIQKDLQISSTQRRIQISQTHNRKDLEHMERRMNHRRKGADLNQRCHLGTVNNDSTIVFRNGKLIPGNFGDETSLSSQSIYKHSSNMDRGAGPNIKLNYKTNFKDLYRGINDFESFERYIHQPLVTPFFDRTAMNIAGETRQHMAHSQYVFKNPSNVLWNPKPSLEYTVCVGNKCGEGAFTNSTSSTSFRQQIKQDRTPFDMSTKYGVERSISSSLKRGRTVPNNHNQLSFCFPEKGSSILKATGQDLLHKTLNKMITLPACAEERNVKTAQRTYGRDSQINERIRNSHMVQSTNSLSHVTRDSYRREPFNMNLAEGVSNFGDFNDDQYQILNKQHLSNSTLSNPMRKHPQPSYGGTFADSFQIPLTRSEYPISNPGRIQNLYKFGENSEYRNFNVPEPRSGSAGHLGRPTDIYSTADRVPEFHHDQEIPRERPRNPFPSSRQTTQVSNHYTSQNQSRNTAVFTNQHSLDYNESNGFKMPMDKPRKRKMVNEPFNETENELKKSRFEDSRFSTTSNIGSSTHISSFYSRKEKCSNGRSVITSVMKSSKAISPVKKITERAMAINDDPMVMNDNHEDVHAGNDNEDDSRSNYFSDNEHEDTVISTNNYTSIKDKPEESVPTVEKRPHPTTTKESTSVAAVANNQKYVICDDEISNIISKKNVDHRNGDDDTFFFKGSYTTTTPSITSETADADLNSICSSKPYSSTSRMENSKIGAGSTTRLCADFTKKYSLAMAVASTSSAQIQNKSSVPIQKSNPVLFDGAFKKPAVVDNRSKSLESPKPNNDGKVSRLANSSPWRFAEANNDDKINRVANCSPWRFSKW